MNTHIKKLLFVSIVILSSLTGCGGGGGASGGESQNVVNTPRDTVPPLGYAFSNVRSFISSADVASYQVMVNSVELGANWFFSVTDALGAQQTRQGQVNASILSITDISWENLADGQLVFIFQLTDRAGNQGNIIRATTIKDTLAPQGYSISLPTLTQSNNRFYQPQLSNAEVGARYRISVSSIPENTQTDIIDSANITSANQLVSGINLSALDAPTLSFELLIEDEAGNLGLPVTQNIANLANVPDVELTNLSGQVTYDYVPHFSNGAGLDYNNTEPRPVRGAVVQFVGSDNQTLVGVTTTDTDGNYRIELPINTMVKVRVLSQLKDSASSQWDFQVSDNTNNNSLYAMEGQLLALDASSDVRNLHAPSGWGGTSYTSTRVAAPFAILDSVYLGLQYMLAVDANIVFPPLELRWSVNNRSVSGNPALGEIGTSSFNSRDVVIHILGNANSDTDEYDAHVVVHEWAHYLESSLWRNDSLGGSHSATNRLDMRVAFSEGWGNAFAGLVLDDPIYKDSGGFRQAGGFTLDVNDENIGGIKGWFSEGSVQSAIYQIATSSEVDANEATVGQQALDMDFGHVYRALANSDYRSSPYFTGIHLFLSELVEQSPDKTQAVSAFMATNHNVNSIAADGRGETNSGNIDGVLPIYKNFTADTVENLCSDNAAGERNKLGNYQYISLVLDRLRGVSLTMQSTPFNESTDPDFFVHRSGTLVSRAESFDAGIERGGLMILDPGQYIIEVAEASNLDNSSATGGRQCFSMLSN